MDITHFVFAFYVFVLVCVTIWFYARVTRKKKSEGSSQEKEQHLFKLYQNVEDMLGGFEEYAEEAKAAIDERLKQAEVLITEARAVAESRPPAAEKALSAQNSQTETFSAEPEPKPEPPVKKAGKSGTQTAVKADKGKRSKNPAQAKNEPEGDALAGTLQNGKAPAGRSRQNAEEMIPQYMAQGMSKEEIARTLGISTREVSLIIELKKIGTLDRKA